MDGCIYFGVCLAWLLFLYTISRDGEGKNILGDILYESSRDSHARKRRRCGWGVSVDFKGFGRGPAAPHTCPRTFDSRSYRAMRHTLSALVLCWGSMRSPQRALPLVRSCRLPPCSACIQPHSNDWFGASRARASCTFPGPVGLICDTPAHPLLNPHPKEQLV